MSCVNPPWTTRRGYATWGARLVELILFSFLFLFVVVVDGKAARTQRDQAIPQASALPVLPIAQEQPDFQIDLTANQPQDVQPELGAYPYTCTVQYFTLPSNLQYVDLVVTG